MSSVVNKMKAVVAVVSLCLSSAAMATGTPIAWDLKTNSTEGYSNTSDSVWNFDGTGWNTGSEVTITSWSTVAGSGTDVNVEKALTKVYNGGLGINHTGETTQGDEHAMDNKNASDGVNQEFFLISFEEKVALKGLYTGWANLNGSDNQSVGLFKVGNAFANDLRTGSPVSFASTFIDNSLIGLDYKNNGYFEMPDLEYYNGVSGAGKSHNWIVSLFNETGTGYDAFKLWGVKGKTFTAATVVSEPGTLALLAIGLGLIIRRKQKAKVANFIA